MLTIPAVSGAHAFTAPLETHGPKGEWHYLSVPAEVSSALGGRRRHPVAGTLNGKAFRSAVNPDGKGGHVLVLRKSLRQGLAPGDLVSVEISVDTAPRPVRVPAELKALLAKDPDATKAYASLSPFGKGDMAGWVAAAKRADTRDRRAANVVEWLREGRRQRP